MKISCVITGDWQCRPNNLTECQEAAKSLIKIVGERKLEVAVFAGDLKDNYNPVDLRVVHFWRNFIRSLKNMKCQPIALLGNHDRSSLNRADDNWLPILEDCGAFICTWQPTQYAGWGKDGSIHLLPFSNSPEQFGEFSKNLIRRKPDPKKDILVFHETFVGAKWNNSSPNKVDSQEGLRLSDLQPDNYKYVLGGDIHKHQKLRENAWYVGSPFPISWGEANQPKVFAVVKDGKLEFVPTGAAGWYDPSVKGFKKPKSWEGTRVRLRVPVKPGEDYTAALEKERTVAKTKYPGAQVTVQAEVVQEEDKSVDAVGDTEDEIIESYISQVVDSNDASAMFSYIQSRLQKVSNQVRQVGKVKFLGASAKNFLSFKEVDLDLSTKGVTLVTGNNLDRPGKSNGSGKTSLLNILPVALFGRTTKNQTTDAWAMRGEKNAWVQAFFQTPDGSMIRVERTRKPSSVKLYKDGVEISAGGTQREISKDIERLCGYSWNTFAATVFLSPEETYAFLWGTPSERHEVIARIQNLERFGLAWDLVKQDKKRLEESHDDVYDEIKTARAKIDALSEVSISFDELNRMMGNLKLAKLQESDLKLKLVAKPSKDKFDASHNKMLRAKDKFYESKWPVERVEEKIKRLKESPEVCPTCGQKIPFDREKLAKEISEATKEMNDLLKIRGVLEKKWKKLLKKDQKISDEYHEALKVYAAVKSEYRSAVKNRESLEEEVDRWQKKAEEERNLLEEWKEILRIQKAAEQTIINEKEFTTKAVEILSREGLPAYLSQMLCPRLNAAADRFSEIFTDGEIRVRFSIEDGQVRVAVLNPHGGETIKDQSTGEGRIAALITSFALREVSGQSSLLVLDEPGMGLDAESYRVFAAGLKKLTEFDSIFVVTHDTGLASELSDVCSLLVTKKDGVSSLSQV